MRSIRGFTLLELMATLALAAILVAATAWALAPAHRAGDVATLARQLAHADALIREEARRMGKPIQLIIRQDNGSLWRSTPPAAPDSSGLASAPPIDSKVELLELPEGYRLSRIIVQNQHESQGVRTISYSSLGYSPTYALLLAPPAPRQPVWLVVTGAGGRQTRVEDPRDVEALFQNLPISNDAD